MTFDEAIQRIKQDSNIVDYIRAHNVDLKQSGYGSYKGLCPFHNEKTPSFSVSEDYQNYRCFGCQEYGDIFTFVMKTHHLEYVDAVKFLAQEMGIQIEFKGGDKESKVDLKSLYNLTEDAAKFYRDRYNKLNDDHPAKMEVKNRGLDVNSELYGYSPEAPNDLYKYLVSKGYTDELIEQSQLVIFHEGRDPWDFFHGRLMIALDDYMGRIVSFTSRKIFEDDKMPGKYVNGKDSPVFHKKNNLFGLSRAKNKARKEKKIYITEGQFDVEALRSIGVENVCAASGTAFTSEHANVLRRLVGEDGEIVFVFDGDKAGKSAALGVFKNHEVLHMQAQIVALADGKDPCDYVVADKKDELLAKLNNSKPIHEYVIDVAMDEFINDGQLDRMRFLQVATKLAKSATSTFIQNSMLSRISILSATSHNEVKEIFNNTKSLTRPTTQKKTEKGEERKLAPKIRIESSKADKMMLSALKLMTLNPKAVFKVAVMKFPDKFKPFIQEVYVNHKRYEEKGVKWKFIPEDYTDKDFVLLIQSMNINNNFSSPEKLADQYMFLYESAMRFYKADYEKQKKAKAMSSIIDSTSASDYAKASELYDDVNKE